MDIYSLSRAWFDWSFDNPEKVSPTHTAVLFFAIEHCNRLGWKKKFGFPSEMAKEALGIKSYNTYINTLNDLIEWGFIEMIEKSKNQYSANIISLSEGKSALSKNDKALDKAMIKHKGKQRESTSESIDSIDIHNTNIQIYKDTNGGFFENEIKRVSDTNLSNSLREWWKYKKGKYTAEGWHKQVTICLKYPPGSVCERIDEAIASGWKGMNLSTIREAPGSAPPKIHRIIM